MNHAPAINLILAMLVIAVTFGVGVWKNVATSFAVCFLPVLLFSRPIVGYALKGGLPDLRMSTAALMGLLGAMAFRFWMHPKIRWSLTDLVVLLAPAVSIASAIDTENWHTGHDELVKQLFGWSLPYFIARYSFRSEDFRKKILSSMIFCTVVLGLFAALEFRMAPHLFDLTLQKFGLGVGFNQQAVQRGAFYRAETSFEHPIFFGDGCVSLLCLILMLAATLKGGWFRMFPLIGAAAAFGGLVTSISFGPLFGMCVAGGIFFLLRFVSISRMYIVAGGVAIAIAGLVMLSVYWAKTEIPERPKNGSLYESFLVRWEIVQKCAPLAMEAGPLGNGRPKITETDIRGHKLLDLESVDNAYMLFYVVRGYIYAAMWASIPLLVSLRVCRVLLKNKEPAFIFPIALGAGSSIGISFAFYFVWAGWNPEPYTILWLMATAFTMSLCDLCLDHAKATAQQRVPAPPAPQVQYPLPQAARLA